MNSSMTSLQDFQVLETLSVQPQREVLKALNPDGDTVILKRLKLGLVKDWKALELFEREAQMLQTLRHERTPRLLDYFYDSIDDETILTQVLEFIPGLSLADKLRQGWRPQEAEVVEMGRQALLILTELHEREPQVIHRDLKPSNLIWTEQQKLFLIDFGAVRELVISKGSSTVIGTFGYMAPEQFLGQSVAATDLYGLGATLLHLLSGRPPCEIPQRQLRLDFAAYVDCSLELQRFLEQLLDPDLDERFQSARLALASLENLKQVTEFSPSGRLCLSREGQAIQIRLEPSSNPVKLYLQQHGKIELAAGLVIGLFWLCQFLSQQQKQVDDILLMHPLWMILFLQAVLIGITGLIMLKRQLVLLAKEHLIIRLSPEQVVLECLHSESLTRVFPRSVVVKFLSSYYLGRTGITRAGVILLYKPTPESFPQEWVIARSLSKRDRHWLLTRLLLFHYQTRQTAANKQT